MAKDNLFLGTARGSVGDVTFSRLNGVQVARVRNRSPRNPQSPAQMVQRIIMSTVGKAYSFMSDICNHSFEGFETGQLSQRKFMEINVGLLRDKCADVLAYPVEEVVRVSTAYNFSFKNDYAPVLNRYMISAGSLPSTTLYKETDEQQVDVGVRPLLVLSSVGSTPASTTYGEIVAALGLQRGDQLSFIQVTHDSTLRDHDADILTGFRYARVILEPASGDMSVPFIANNAINDPNERNEGSFSVLEISGASETRPAGILFVLQDVVNNASSDRHLAGSAVIVSRQIGGRWLRSTQFIELRRTSGTQVLNNSKLGLAYETYRLASSSDLYLNQAE